MFLNIELNKIKELVALCGAFAVICLVNMSMNWTPVIIHTHSQEAWHHFQTIAVLSLDKGALAYSGPERDQRTIVECRLILIEGRYESVMIFSFSQSVEKPH